MTAANAQHFTITTGSNAYRVTTVGDNTVRILRPPKPGERLSAGVALELAAQIAVAAGASPDEIADQMQSIEKETASNADTKPAGQAQATTEEYTPAYKDNPEAGNEDGKEDPPRKRTKKAVGRKRARSS